MPDWSQPHHRQTTGCGLSMLLHGSLDARQCGRGKGWALHHFFLRPPRSYDRRSLRCNLASPLHWIFLAPRGAFKHRALVDRQCPVINIALDVAALQYDPDGADGALHGAADDNFLRDDATLDLCAFADHEL